MRFAFFLALLVIGCSESSRPGDGGGSDGALDAALDAAMDAEDDASIDAPTDAGETCDCLDGPHLDHIYVISDGGEIWTYKPETEAFEFVFGPVCGGATPFSMAVDTAGMAWINVFDDMGVRNLDLLDPGPCTDSPYLRTNPDFGLFGMSFASNSATDFCSDLYVMTYSGDGPFAEGPDLGLLGVIDPESGDIRELATTNFDGGELTGTGDGRLFGFAGDDPVKLVEYDRATGALLDTIELTGVEKTNASAAAFYAGDLWLFTEAIPDECEPCLVAECGDALTECRADPVCADHLSCVLSSAMMTDECGGFLTEEVRTCVFTCESCSTRPRFRVSRVIRYDLDGSEGGGFTELSTRAPVRVVGAASSPCVPTEPF